MIRGWLIDHRFFLVMITIAVAVPFTQGVDASMRNPISETLTVARAADITYILTMAALSMCLRSRTAEHVWVDTGFGRRATWFAVLAVLAVIVSSILAPGGAQFRYQFTLLGVVFGTSSLLTLLDEERSGLLWLFVIGVSALLTPRTLPAPWWTPLYAEHPSPVAVAVAGLMIVLAALTYSTNLFDRRRF